MQQINHWEKTPRKNRSNQLIELWVQNHKKKQVQPINKIMATKKQEKTRCSHAVEATSALNKEEVSVVWTAPPVGSGCIMLKVAWTSLAWFCQHLYYHAQGHGGGEEWLLVHGRRCSHLPHLWGIYTICLWYTISINLTYHICEVYIYHMYMIYHICIYHIPHR